MTQPNPKRFSQRRLATINQANIPRHSIGQ
jgi:hypothetical protein